MDLTTGVRKLLIQAAHKNPHLREKILPIVSDKNFTIEYDGLGKEAGLSKTAIKPETEAFIAWALIKNNAMNVAKFEKTVEKLTGLQASSAPVKKKRGALGVGERILVDKHNNTNPQNVDVCEEFHGEQGTVIDVTPACCLVVEFDNGKKAEFDGLEAGKPTGLYRNSKYKVDGKKTWVECIYLKGTAKPPPIRSQEAMQKYLERGNVLKQNRDLRYHSGTIAVFRYNKKSQVYIGINTQQRPYPINVNPLVGKVLYLAALGKRPNGWKKEAEEWGIIV